MRSLSAFLFCLTAIGLTGVNPASAQQRTASVRSGQPSVIWVFYNCGPRGSVPAVSGAASNGTVSTRPGTRNRCGNQSQPVVETVYTSRPGYRGPDEVIIYGPNRPRVRVNVL